MNKKSIDEGVLHAKMLRKLTKYMNHSVSTPTKDGSTKKCVIVDKTKDGLVKAYIKDSFQVAGVLFNIELVHTHRYNPNEGRLQKDSYLIKYNSRSYQGGHVFTEHKDIAANLHLTVEELKAIFKNLEEKSRFSLDELKHMEERHQRKAIA